MAVEVADMIVDTKVDKEADKQTNKQSKVTMDLKTLYCPFLCGYIQNPDDIRA